MKKTIFAILFALMGCNLMYAASSTYNAIYVWNAAGTSYTVYLLSGQPTILYDQSNVKIYSGGELKKTISLSNVSNVSVTYGVQSSAFKLNASGYGTFSYQNDVKIYTSGVKAYTAKVDGERLMLTEITNKLVPAGTGVVLVGTANKTFYVTEQKATGTLADNDLMPTTLADGSLASIPSGKFIYVVSGNEFKKYVGSTFSKYKAYLALDSEVSAEAKFILPEVEILDDEDEDDGDETVIRSISSKGAANSNVYYDLSGRKVMNPVHGIYIKDGKKVLVK